MRTCTIITAEPNELMATMHDRMPGILDEMDWSKWLGEEPSSEGELKSPLVPCLWGRIKMWAVDKRVGKVRRMIAIWSKRWSPRFYDDKVSIIFVADGHVKGCDATLDW